MKVYVIFFCSIALIAGCDLFSTRTPEDPDTGRTGFQPPTTPSIVLSNFSHAINEKNAENFMACLGDTAQGFALYRFTPSGEGVAKFPGIFNSWDRFSEQQNFNTIIASIKGNEKPELHFGKGIEDFEVILSDSAVFYSEYNLLVPHSEQSLPKRYKGAMQLTLTPNQNQRWAITGWIDISTFEDSSETSWSILKAQFSN